MLKISEMVKIFVSVTTFVASMLISSLLWAEMQTNGCDVAGACSIDDWSVDCLSRTDADYNIGPTAQPEETWSMVLQNGARLGTNSVMCLCNRSRVE